MCVSPRLLLKTSLLLVDVLIYLPNLTTCRPGGCPGACFCEESDLGEVSLMCTKADILDTVPQMPVEYAKMVVKIIIQNQPRLTSMGQHSLQNYSSLKHLYLRGNPLRCNCSNAWTRNTSRIIDAEEVTCVHTATEADSECRLNMHAAKLEDKSAEVTNSTPPLGQTLMSADRLFPCEPPCVQIDSDVIEVPEGSDVNVTCTTCNNQTGAVMWQVTNLDSNWTQMLLASGHVLQLHNVSSTDHFKMVTCTGNNTEGSSTTTTRIVIPSSPTITSLDFSFRSPVLTISYSISGWPPPELEWVKQTLSLPNSSFILDTEMILNNVGVFMGSRIISPVGLNSDGIYTLIATNREGTTNRTVNVTAPADVTFVPTLLPSDPDSLPKSVITLADISTDAHFLWGTASVFELQISLAVTSGILITVLVTVFSVCVRQRLKRRTHVPSKRMCGTPVVNKKSQSFPEALPLTGLHLVENPYYNRNRSKKHLRTNTCIKTVKLETILLMHVIGEGAFGRVYLGSCVHLLKKDEFTMVAVKTLKGESSDTLKKDLEREADMLATLEHQNIITFYGICTEEKQTSCRNHSPDLTLLRRGESPPADEAPLTLIHLLQISVQIASGMEYLASQHFVHRDMATRNCLVDTGLVVKIGDFGMSRDVYNTDYYKVGGESVMLPIRWMPPESILYRTFTVESDVWSFGVTLWEVFTYGRQPWFEYSNCEVIEHIKRCRHLRRPHKCPESVYKVMLGCWSMSPQERLSMKEIYKLLTDDLLSNQHEYLDILP